MFYNKFSQKYYSNQLGTSKIIRVKVIRIEKPMMITINENLQNGILYSCTFCDNTLK